MDLIPTTLNAIYYLLIGAIFWRMVVSTQVHRMLADGDDYAKAHLADAQSGAVALLSVKAVVLLFWPAFLILGLATRCSGWLSQQEH